MDLVEVLVLDILHEVVSNLPLGWSEIGDGKDEHRGSGVQPTVFNGSDSYETPSPINASQQQQLLVEEGTKRKLEFTFNTELSPISQVW